MKKMKRIAWIDYSKAFLITAVVLAHCSRVPQFLDTLICGFHMLAFFMISGYLHKPNPDLYGGLIKNARRLLLPSLLFSLLCYTIFFLPLRFLRGGSFSFIECVWKPFLGLFFYDRSIASPVCGVIWFLVTLFLCFLMLDIIKGKIRSVILIICICITCTAFFYHLNFENFTYLYYLQRMMASFPFVALGYLARQYNWNISAENTPINRHCLYTLVLILIYCTLCLYNGRVGIHSYCFGYSILLYYVISIIGSFALFSLLGFIKKQNNVVVTYSIGTIVILCLHKTMIYLIGYFVKNPYIITFLIMIVFYPVIFLFNKYLPWFMGNRNYK